MKRYAGGLCGAAGAMLVHGLGPRVLAVDSKAAKAAPKAKAKSVIQIFLWGGMSHNDTWDPKPESGQEYMGEFSKAIPTNVPGIQLGETVSIPGEAGGQVFADPEHDAPEQRARDGRLPDADGPYAGGAVGLSEHWGGVCVVQKPRVQGDDSALRGADASAGAIF